jgi:hypothetical protein
LYVDIPKFFNLDDAIIVPKRSHSLSDP